jgi:hypothetical protein
METPPTRIALVAGVFNVFLLAAVLWLAVMCTRRAGHTRGIARLAFVILVIVALNGVRQQVPALSLASMLHALGKGGVGVLGATAVLSGGFAALRWRMRLVRLAEFLMLILFPFALLTISRAAWALINYDAAFAEFATRPSAQVLHQGTQRGPRVLWLIFDEMDQRLTFAERPSFIQLPELDRLRRQAVYATNAYPPAGETLLSMPAYITGRQIADAQATGASDLAVTLVENGKAVSLRSLPNIFSTWRAAGSNVAVIGFFHPYCRLFDSSLTLCSWHADYSIAHMWRHAPVFTTSETVLIQDTQVIDTLPLSKRLRLARCLLRFMHGAQRKKRALSVQRYERALEDTKGDVVRRDVDKIFAHFPVPHPPYIYSRVDGHLVEDTRRSYFDNLVLVDRTLGELRQAMEAAGVWDDTTVAVSSDHWFRTNLWKPWRSDGENSLIGNETDYRVPLLIKLAGQTTGVTYDTPFNTIVLHDFLLALGTQITTPDNAVQWLDAHRSLASPICGIASACPRKPPVNLR